MISTDNRDIMLSTTSPLNSGMERTCYVHPHDPDLVIKVPRRLKHSKCRSNATEMQGYRLLQQDDIQLDFISHCHGYVDTDLGEGLLCDCIRDNNGDVSQTIWDIVIYQNDCNVNNIKNLMEKFCDNLISQHVRIFDLNLKNIVLKNLGNGGFKPYLIDLKGRAAHNELIPVSRLIPYFSLRKLKRRSRQLIHRISDFRHRRRELQYTLDE